jgi:hypothetical protein
MKLLISYFVKNLQNRHFKDSIKVTSFIARYISIDGNYVIPVQRHRPIINSEEQMTVSFNHVVWESSYPSCSITDFALCIRRD